LAGGTLGWTAPAGPTPQIPAGGGEPGTFPNTSVSAVNVVARGSSSAFDGRVDVPGLEGQGPIPWSVNRYNRGDFALRLAPADPVAALDSLGKGFVEFAETTPGLAFNRAWRPSPRLGIVIPTARQNGPVNWNDGEGVFYPTIALSESSSGPGYSMVDGSFGNGDLDINTGRAGSHASSPEANFSFSATWFPYDQGWLGGEVAGPTAEGVANWTHPAAHAIGLTPGLVKWLDFPEGSFSYGGLAELRLPAVNALEDGMLFATSSDGGSDVNIVGVAPLEDGRGWLITLREDSELDAETLAAAGQSEFQFVYVPFNAGKLIGGHIQGSTGAKRKAVGDFAVSRTGVGNYELSIPGKTGVDGALLLQVADLEAGTSAPLASRAFLSYEYQNGKFVIQSRKTTTDETANLADASFYVAWVDFRNPLEMPEGPRFRGLPAVVVSGEDVVAKECAIAASTEAPELLVTSIDSTNVGGYLDPITQQPAAMALVGRFYDSDTLQPTSEPFVILANPIGTLNRSDAKYNPVSKQYVVVANARAAGTLGSDVAVIALVRSAAASAGAAPLVKAFVHDGSTDESYDDVAVAVSAKNGNFLLVAERKFSGEGEGTVGALYNQAGTLLTPAATRLDLLQTVGDEDDPDVVYLPDQDAFLYLSNTDNSNGSTGTLSNRIVGSVVNSSPDAQGRLVVRPEQPLSDGLPQGRAEGHPASLLNPFNGQLITAYDAGNGTPNGDLSFFNLGPAPSYTFTAAQPEVPYLTGNAGTPLKHQHPQLAADPHSGVIVVGFNATGSDLGLPEAYVFVALGPDGQPLPTPLKAPYFLAESPGGLGTTVNFHNVIYSPASKSFLAVYTSNPGVTYLAGLQVTSSHLAPATPPELLIAAAGGQITLSWPAASTGFVLEFSPRLPATTWAAVPTAPVQEGGLNRVTVPATEAAAFYRLKK
jgi:hypothetical protein